MLSFLDSVQNKKKNHQTEIENRGNVHCFFLLLAAKLPLKFSLMAACRVAPFPEMFHLAALFTGNDCIIALEGAGTVIIFDDLSFPIKALTRIKPSGQLIKILDSCHFCGLLCFVVLMIAQGKAEVKKKKIKSCKTNQGII